MKELDDHVTGCSCLYLFSRYLAAGNEGVVEGDLLVRFNKSLLVLLAVGEC